MRGWAIVLVAGILTVACGFLAGRALGGQQAEALAFDLSAPSYDSASVSSGKTVAGFSGFEPGSGLDGAVLFTGKVASVTDGVLSFQTTSGLQTFRISGSRSLRQVQPATPAALTPGAKVVVLPGATGGDAPAVLVLSPAP